MKNYNILFVLVPPFNPQEGGVQMTTFKLATQFSLLGHKVSIFSFSNYGNLKQELFEVVYTENENGCENVLNIQQLESFINEFKPDVVINQMPYEKPISISLFNKKVEFNYLLLACLRNTLFSVKLNIDDYILSTLPKKITPFFKNLPGRFIFQLIHKFRHAKDLRMILDAYDRFVMFGPQNLGEIQYFIGKYKNDKLAYIPNSIPNTLEEVPIKEKVILFLGRLTKVQKRVELLLPLWERLMNRLPDWQFWIVGDGDEKNELEFQVQKEKISGVKFWGKQEPYWFYEKASVFIMTSAFEGFPNTIIEAQSRAAAPVLMNSYPLLEWLVEDMQNAILVKPYDLDQMADEIYKLVTDENRLLKLQHNALQNAKRFEIDTVSKLWIQLFDKHFNQ